MNTDVNFAFFTKIMTYTWVEKQSLRLWSQQSKMKYRSKGAVKAHQHWITLRQ